MVLGYVDTGVCSCLDGTDVLGYENLNLDVLFEACLFQFKFNQR